MATIGTKLTIEYSAPGSSSKKSANVGYINPNASDYDIKTFANKLMALTNNSLTGIYRVDTTNISGANPTLVISPDSVVEELANGVQGGYVANLTFAAGGDGYLSYEADGDDNVIGSVSIKNSDKTIKFSVQDGAAANATLTFTWGANTEGEFPDSSVIITVKRVAS